MFKFYVAPKIRVHQHYMYAHFFFHSWAQDFMLIGINALRRTFYSRTGGYQVSRIKTSSHLNEYLPLWGFQESIFDFLAALKMLIFRGKDYNSYIGSLQSSGPILLIAAFIQLHPNICLVNKNHYLGTLLPGFKFRLYLEIVFVWQRPVHLHHLTQRVFSSFWASRAEGRYLPKLHIQSSVKGLTWKMLTEVLLLTVSSPPGGSPPLEILQGIEIILRINALALVGLLKGESHLVNTAF
uniref:RNA polymerase alpha subunit n=2 Tax=Chromera velia TaxID=505693 RepID=D9IXD7_9ALVE|nr:RNA polymerase alpha subunit [Chromera velia]ADJ66545.1 RNA polymerase alpha subunit [Chromera velia]